MKLVKLIKSKNGGLIKKYDVIIVGAGPGGLAAAKELSLNHKNVLVLEKNKVIGPKTCAGGLTTKDFSLGIPKKLAESFFSKVTIHTPIGSSVISGHKPFVATVNRHDLGQYMADEARKAGAEILTEIEVSLIDKTTITTKNGEKYHFDYLIGADGSRSIVRKHLNLKNNKEMVAIHYKAPNIFPEMEFYFDAKMFGSGYAWIFPHKDFTSIGCGVDPKFIISAKELQQNFKKWLKEIWLKERFFDLENAEYEAWMINYDYQGHEFGNIFLVGDAAGFASGLTGEGMYFAMVSGIETAKKILCPSYRMPEIERILKTKKHHENVLSLMEINKTLSQLEYDALTLLLKTKLLDKNLLKSFS